MRTVKEVTFKMKPAKYFQIAQSERVVIENDGQNFELVKKKLITEEDLANAYTGEELKKAIEPRIRAMFEK